MDFIKLVNEDKFQQAFDSINVQKDGENIAAIKNGIVNTKMGEFHTALQFFESAKEVVLDDDKLLALYYDCYGLCYGQNGDLDKALLYLKKCFKIVKEEDCPILITDNLYHLIEYETDVELKCDHQVLLLKKLNNNCEEYFGIAVKVIKYFMEIHNYKLAKHHLIILENKVSTNQELLAEVNFLWLKYSVNLLNYSQYQLSLKQTVYIKKPEDAVSRYNYYLEDHDGSDYVTSEVAYEYNDSRDIFLFGLKKFNESMDYFGNIEEYPLNYVNLILDVSKLYQHLAFFELHISKMPSIGSYARQAKMHKRRLDHLERTISKINPEMCLIQYRRLLYEAGETYFIMMDIKTRVFNKASSNKQYDPKLLTKMAYLSVKGIEILKTFVDTFNDVKTGELGDLNNRDESDIKWLLMAYYLIATLYNKFFSPNQHDQMKAVQNAAEYYEKIASFCSQYPEWKSIIEEEYESSVQLSDLLKKQVKAFKQDLMDLQQ